VVKEKMRILSVGNVPILKYIPIVKPTSSRSRGFTLLELIVVLVIISLMMALVAPRLTGSLTKMNLKTAGQKISSSLRYARSQAVTNQIIHYAVFDFETNSVHIKAEKPLNYDAYSNAENESAYTDNSKEKDTGVVNYFLPEGVKFKKAIIANEQIDTGVFRIGFYPSGNSSGGNVFLTDEKERRFKLSVNSITGITNLTEPDD
jgi:prepilin-type N-terminal cleavage/methylation domain-containing protein